MRVCVSPSVCVYLVFSPQRSEQTMLSSVGRNVIRRHVRQHDLSTSRCGIFVATFSTTSSVGATSSTPLVVPIELVSDTL